VPVPVLSVRDLTKAFGGTLALDRLDLDVEDGSIHALLGENGAGKSTLIKIIAGVYRQDGGTVAVNGTTLLPGARPARTAFIHQELGLVDSMTIAENVALTRGYPLRRSLVSWRRLRNQAQEDLARVGFDVDVSRNVGRLSAADRALVAIARALALVPRLLVLDEPTAALPEADVARLFEVLRHLRDNGLGILYVSHRLDEVFRLCDTVTVIRDGRRVLACPLASSGPGELVEAITGRSAQAVTRASNVANGREALTVSELVAKGVGPISFSLREGEILALVGLRGAGHEVVARTLFGDAPMTSGSVMLDGQPAKLRGATQAVRNGIGLVPGNRYGEGIAASLKVRENLVVNPHRAARHDTWVGCRRERRSAAELVDRFDIRPRDPEINIATLSGGNQQKVVLARWMEAGCRVLILEDPTSGVDVGARAEIYALVMSLLMQQVAVLLVSSDFEEVANLAQRVLVMRRGKLVAELNGEHISIDTLTATATGAVMPAAGGH
jgi:ribose transport system ATP-binding protein